MDMPRVVEVEALLLLLLWHNQLMIESQYQLLLRATINYPLLLLQQTHLGRPTREYVIPRPLALRRRLRVVLTPMMSKFSELISMLRGGSERLPFLLYRLTL